MAQYCPKGFISSKEEKSITRNSWAEIWDEVRKQNDRTDNAAAQIMNEEW